MEILDDEKNHETIAWLPHGRAFVVLRRKALEQKILPKYFHKQSKYSSFTRKLNRWGFIRVTRGPETGAYYHTFFQRDGHRLLLQMSCQSGPSKASAASNDPTKGSPSVGPGGGVAAAVLGGSPLALTAGQAVFQQQNQLLQMQIQQQLLQQELTRRALAGQQALQLQQQPQPQLYAQLGSALGARFGGLGTSFGNLPAGLSGAASLPLLGQGLGIPDARLLQFIQQGTTEEKRGGDGDSQGST